MIAALIQPEQEDVTRELGVDEGTLGAIVAGVLIVGVAPFTEEVFFRGFMFTGMRRALPFVLAALVPSLIWGLFHYTGPESWEWCCSSRSSASGSAGCMSGPDRCGRRSRCTSPTMRSRSRS